MRYCTKCITPSTRPNIKFDAEGVCSACRNHLTKPAIDWKGRELAFREVVKNAKAKSAGYDCVVPVSGGKDSTWQILKCLEVGLKPLAVTWKTPARTELGRKNLENLVNIGVDHIDFQISPKVEKVFMVEALEKFGSTAIPMHLAIFSIPLKIAAKFSIPLVVWGENSAFEYGNAEDVGVGFRLDSAWLKKYGVTHGTTAADWISPRLSRKDLTPYFGPTDEELAGKTSGVFLGYYYQWDPEETFRVAKANGFQADSQGPRTGLYDYADIDDDFISIHHWMKWHKFGFSRLFDNLSLEIRNGRITRDQAVKIVREKGDQTPRADIAKFCSFAGLEEKKFFEIVERFRNKEVWHQEAGVWKIKDFLVGDWKW